MDSPSAVAPPNESSSTTRRARLAAGSVACLTLLAIGWTGLLIPSLIRSIKETFDQTDAGIGIVYLVWAVAYVAGSFAGGWLTERLGRRLVLGGAVVVHGLGVVGLGLAPAWGLFVAASVASGSGAGSLDGGANGLVLDVYREGRGRAMNLIHLSFSVGALCAPVIVGVLVESGLRRQAVAIASGALVALLAVAYAIVPMPSGRRARRRSRAAPARQSSPSPSFGASSSARRMGSAGRAARSGSSRSNIEASCPASSRPISPSSSGSSSSASRSRSRSRKRTRGWRC